MEPCRNLVVAFCIGGSRPDNTTVPMLKFLKAVGAVVVGNLITAGIVLALFVAGLVALVSVFQNETAETRAAKSEVRKNAVLVIDTSLRLTDTPDNRSAGQVIADAFSDGDGKSVGLLDLTRAIDAAAKDKKIRAVLIRGTLQTGDFASGYPALAELRRAIVRFRASGKPVTAYLDSPAFRDYYLATAADTVIIHPFAELPVRGLATNNVYFGETLKKYGVGVQTTKVGVYKSAVEPFTGDRMSDADRRQTKELLDGVWNSLTADIAADRKIDPAKLRDLADTGAMFTADDARQLRLADRSAYLDEIIDEFREKGATDDATRSFVQIDALDYIRRLPKRPTLDDSGDKVVVLYAEGEITDGDERDAGSFGGDRLAAEIRDIRRRDNVKALVLRVNSPGGSAFASEVARRELGLFKKSGRPLVVSMGSYAASGGYWLSAGADRIFAGKTTVTGSIGVFGLMFDIRDLAAGFGVKFDGVKTSRFADIETASRPKTPEELALLQKLTDRIYDNFLKLVADGRGLSLGRVAEIAQGRVWSGEAALKLGLTDEIGGLGDAIAYALKMAKISDKSAIAEVPGRREPGEIFARMFSGDKSRPPVARLSGPAAQIGRIMAATLRTLAHFDDRHGVYARIPYIMEMN